jgi:hypothetical protein
MKRAKVLADSDHSRLGFLAVVDEESPTKNPPAEPIRELTRNKIRHAHYIGDFAFRVLGPAPIFRQRDCAAHTYTSIQNEVAPAKNRPRLRFFS